MRAVILSIVALLLLAGCYTEELSRTETVRPMTRPEGYHSLSAMGARPRSMAYQEPEPAPWWQFEWLLGQESDQSQQLNWHQGQIRDTASEQLAQ